MGIVWIGKATVQAALSALFLNAVKKHPESDVYDEYEDYGNKIQTTAIFAIVICATTGSILLNSLGTTLLTQDPVKEPPKDDEKISKTVKPDSEAEQQQPNADNINLTIQN